MRLIMAKNRIAPIKIIDIVRLELCGALLGARMRTFILDNCGLKFEGVYHFVDSEIVKGQVGKASYGFDTFTGNKVGEIERRSQPKEWFWIPGALNVADLITRGCSPSKLGLDSVWQNAPEVFKEAECVWTTMVPPTPNRELRGNATTTKHQTLHVVGDLEVPDSIEARINIDRFSSYTRLMHVTARVLAMYKPPPAFTNAVNEISIKDVEEAEMFWIRCAQRSITQKDLETTYVRLGPKVREDGIITVGHRMEKWMQMTYNNNKLILLPYHHPISKLFVLEKHNSLHISGYTGIQATACKVRLKFWITRLETMIKSIKHKCVDCRKLNKARLKEKQAMASLPIDRLKPAPPWYSVTIDFTGPHEVKGEVNKRSRGKAYGVIFTCNLTRATHIEISPDYGTDSFLSALRRFMNIRRNPAKIRSDRGSQLVSANEELKRMILGLNLQQLREFGIEEGFEWDFSPAEAPWYNGCAESMVKAMKRALSVALRGTVPSFLELLTIFYEISNLLNERPIGKVSHDIEDGTYVCPNDLLIGCASKVVPKGPFQEYTSMKERLNFIQGIVDAFWVKMTRSYFPSLIVEQKRQTESWFRIRTPCVVSGNWPR